MAKRYVVAIIDAKGKEYYMEYGKREYATEKANSIVNWYNERGGRVYIETYDVFQRSYNLLSKEEVTICGTRLK